MERQKKVLKKYRSERDRYRLREPLRRARHRGAHSAGSGDRGVCMDSSEKCGLLFVNCIDLRVLRHLRETGSTPNKASDRFKGRSFWELGVLGDIDQRLPKVQERTARRNPASD